MWSTRISAVDRGSRSTVLWSRTDATCWAFSTSGPSGDPWRWQIVRELDSTFEVTGLRTMNDVINEQISRERSLSSLVGCFSVLALVLACLGLYGTLAYSVARRTREIGVRMALGAQARNVLSAVVRQGMTLTLVGCVLGVLLAAALTRVVSSLLYGVAATDPFTFVSTVLLFSAVALVSCWLPARRAARIDPMEALRYE